VWFGTRGLIKLWNYRSRIWIRFKSKSSSGPCSVPNDPAQAPLDGPSAQHSPPGADRADPAIPSTPLRGHQRRQLLNPRHRPGPPQILLPCPRRKRQYRDPGKLLPPWRLRNPHRHHLPRRIPRSRFCPHRQLRPPNPLRLRLHGRFWQGRERRVETSPRTHHGLRRGGRRGISLDITSRLV
jgi:hypothetical protein